MNCEECRDYIDPYCDSELDAGDAVRLERHLRDCSDCRSRLQCREELKVILRNPEIRFEMPQTLPAKVKSKIYAHLQSGSTWRFGKKYSLPSSLVPLGLAAAMALLFGLLFVNRTGLFQRFGAPSLVDEVVASHVRSMLAAHLLDVSSSDKHTVKPWFDGRLKFAPPVQDFADHGFRLIGGRLDYLGGREAAALVYQRNKHIINLFIWPSGSAGSSSVRSHSSNGYNTLNWNRNGFEWWAISDVNADDLQAFAGLARQERSQNGSAGDSEQ